MTFRSRRMIRATCTTRARRRASSTSGACRCGCRRGRRCWRGGQAVASMIRAILFDQGDTLWHFPRMPAPAELGAEASRRAVAVLESWGLPADDGLRRLAMDTFLKSQLAELEAYRTHLVSPDPAAVLRELAAERGVELEPGEGPRAVGGLPPRGRFPQPDDLSGHRRHPALGPRAGLSRRLRHQHAVRRAAAAAGLRGGRAGRHRGAGGGLVRYRLPEAAPQDLRARPGGAGRDAGRRR